MEPTTRENILAFLKEVRQRMELREKELAENNARSAVLREELEYLNNVAISLDALTMDKVMCEPEPILNKKTW